MAGSRNNGFLDVCSRNGKTNETTGTAVELDFSTITTGKGMQIDCDGLTTGSALEVRVDSDVVTTGKAISVLSGSDMDTSVFSVDEDGDVVFAGSMEPAGDITLATSKKTIYRDSTIYINSSADTQLDIVADGEVQVATAKLDVNAVLDVEDTAAGGASTGNIVKKTLQAGEAYTGTTAGLMVKHYDADNTVTVPIGEFTGLYVNLKGLHTDPGNNTSLISAHVHASNTTTVHAGLWLYGDMTNGVKASGSTLTTFLDGHEATAITNLADLKAGTDLAVEASVATPAGNTTHCMRILIDGTTPGYIPVYAAKSF